MTVRLDVVDRKILSELQKDASRSLDDIAKTIGAHGKSRGRTTYVPASYHVRPRELPWDVPANYHGYTSTSPRFTHLRKITPDNNVSKLVDRPREFRRPTLRIFFF